MSAAAVEKNDDTKMFCAACGTAEGDDIKLKRCNGCYLVRYCSVKCQKDHRPKHKKECKKRAAELRDEILFKQPESTHQGDCPICCLPLPNITGKIRLCSCCCKYICAGCNYTNQKREYERNLQQKCPFCREPAPKTEEESDKQLMKRVEANDPVAVRQLGKIRYKEGDYETAFEYLNRAAALGDAEAHYQLSLMYLKGLFVEKDEKKELHHLTEAAIGGHPGARFNLACLEGRNGRVDRAVKHFIIAAKLGHDSSLENLKNGYKDGVVSKEDFDAALRGYQATVEATKSPQREEAYAYELTT